MTDEPVVITLGPNAKAILREVRDLELKMIASNPVRAAEMQRALENYPWHCGTILDLDGERQDLWEVLAFEKRMRRKKPDWRLPFDSILPVLMSAEVVSLLPYKPEAAADGVSPIYGLCVMDYDTFGPGYTAFNPITTEQAMQIFRFYVRDRDMGVRAWLVWNARNLPHRCWMPNKMWDFEALARGVLPDDLKAVIG